MSNYTISGIQQIGVGVKDATKAWHWYAKHFGFDLSIFDDEAEAALMKKYTGGQAHKRKAILAMNLKGGGGLEIWQYTSRTPSDSPKVEVGDLGINQIILRSSAIEESYAYFQKMGADLLSGLDKNSLGQTYFILNDPYGNAFKIIGENYQFMDTGHKIGGVMGASMGVSDIKKTIAFYEKFLNYVQNGEVYTDEQGFERVWLKPKQKVTSAFSDLLGPTQLELVCDPKGGRKNSFEGRYWGDCGYIHICFDVQGMNYLRAKCEKENNAFEVDSENSFDMGEAAGQFAYIEDTDKTLIELVETHKVPIMKKIGWYINLKGKKVQKTLPHFIFKVLAKKRIKL